MRNRYPMALSLCLLPAVAHAADANALGRLAGFAQPVLLGLAVLLGGIGFTAAMLVTQLAIPGLVRRSALLARRTPGRSLLYGVLVTVIVVLGLALARTTPAPFGKLLALALILPWMALLVLGLAAASYSLGESLLSASGSSREGAGPWAAGAGAALLALVNLLPLFGQAVTIVAALGGVGAVARAVLTRPAQEAAGAGGAGDAAAN